MTLGSALSLLSWGHYQLAVLRLRFSGALHCPLALACPAVSHFGLLCELVCVLVSPCPAGTSTSSCTSASLFRTSASTAVFALRFLHTYSFALHFLQLPQSFKTQIVFFAQFASHCLALHSMSSLATVLQCLMSSGPEERVAAFKGLTVHQLALLQDDIRAALLNVDSARPAPASSSDAPAGSSAPRPAQQPAAPHQDEDDDEDYAPRRHGRDYDEDWDRGAPSTAPRGPTPAPAPPRCGGFPPARQSYDDYDRHRAETERIDRPFYHASGKIRTELRWVQCTDGVQRPMFQHPATCKPCCAQPCDMVDCPYGHPPCQKPLRSPPEQDLHETHRCSKCKEAGR